jgi:hypothetical protein
MSKTKYKTVFKLIVHNDQNPIHPEPPAARQSAKLTSVGHAGTAQSRLGSRTVLLKRRLFTKKANFRFTKCNALCIQLSHRG